MKKALITGIAGQDGSYLAELLLGKGYEVHGVDSRNFENNKESFWRLGSATGKIIFHSGDITNHGEVEKIVEKTMPDEIYHLATKHDVPNSLENYLATRAINLDSTYFFLLAIKKVSPTTKLFFASSSKVFGNPQASPQNEEASMNPGSLYGISKVAAFALVKMYREKEDIFACTGILYNHESPRRDQEFLPRKISKGVAEIKRGAAKKIKLGDLSARRDWSFAGDIVQAMWLMLQAKEPGDYVLGSGETHSVEEFLDTAFNFAGLDWRQHVEIDEALSRPKETELRADITKAKNVLGWGPRVKFEDLVGMMVESDLGSVKGKN